MLSRPQRCFLNLFACCLLPAITPVTAEETPADPDPARFEEAIQKFAKDDQTVQRSTVGTLFVGSSSIRLWPLDESFPGNNYLNRGFGGAHISDMLHFADRVIFRYQPKQIVFFCGVNDIAYGKPPARVFRDFKRFVTRLRQACPGTRLIVLANKPSPKREKFLENVRQLNHLLSGYAQQHSDMTLVSATFDELLTTENAIRGELFVDDGIHLNSDGYRLWTSAVQRELQRTSQTSAAGAK